MRESEKERYPCVWERKDAPVFGRGKMPSIYRSDVLK
jgi:hypothetical protein